MTSPIIIAQVGGMATGIGGNAPRDIKLVKPQGNQAITIALDGTVRLDFSAIANENLTLVHIGDRLIILFDNHAEITLAGFYGEDGNPLADLTIELGPGRDVSAADFANLVPITTDPSVLPASGGPGSVSSGAYFASFSIDALTGAGPGLPLLGPSAFGGPGFSSTIFAPHGTVPEALTLASIVAAVGEGGLITDTLGTVGNFQGVAFSATGVAGSLNGLVNFGTGGPNATPFQFVPGPAANAWLASLGLTSHGAAIDTAAINGQTLVAGTDPAQGTPHDVFSLTIQSDGSWSFTLLAPLDDAAGGGANTATIDLSGLVQAVDAAGVALTLSDNFKITVADDVPLLTSASASGSVDEGALTLAATIGDLFGTGNGPVGAVKVVSGSLSDLVSFGADGPDGLVVGSSLAAAGFQFAVASGESHDFGILSHGEEVDFVTVADGPAGPHGVSQTLTAWTNGGPAGQGHAVFTLVLDGDGTYVFTLVNPLDHNGDDTSALTLELSSLIKAVDFDGDSVALAGGFAITITNDVPVLTGAIDASGEVDEGALAASATPGDLFGDGNDQGVAGATTVVNGSVAGLVSFGADGPALTLGNLMAGFRFVIADNTPDSTLIPDLTSHGDRITFFTVVTPEDGSSQTLTAWAGGSADDGGHAVFTLLLNGDGSYVFTLVNPLDQSAPGEDTTTL
ncbi:MAG: hypothetical protein QOG74_2796, partial [Alphaproteobacteria bacterium]|nr:hypothetical protein [Alphaproteobacteria bacterium]